MKEQEILQDLERMTMGWEVPPDWRKPDGEEKSQVPESTPEEDRESHD